MPAKISWMPRMKGPRLRKCKVIYLPSAGQMADSMIANTDSVRTNLDGQVANDNIDTSGTYHSGSQTSELACDQKVTPSK